MKIIALDVGAKRTGVAFADSALKMVFPREALTTEQSTGILKILETEKIDLLLVGLPVNNDGSEGAQAQEVRKFIDTLGKLSVKVEYISEYGTSIEAQQRFRSLGYDRKIKKGAIDSVAATLILESYLARL